MVAYWTAEKCCSGSALTSSGLGRGGGWENSNTGAWGIRRKEGAAELSIRGMRK